MNPARRLLLFLVLLLQFIEILLGVIALISHEWFLLASCGIAYLIFRYAEQFILNEEG